jgi:hypothetical protein
VKTSWIARLAHLLPLAHFVTLSSRRAAPTNSRVTVTRTPPATATRAGEPAGNTGSGPKLKVAVPKLNEGSDDDDDDPTELTGNSVLASARRRERRRCERIIMMR